MGFLGAILALSAWGHIHAGLTLPIPWEDEASLLSPAIHFAQSGTLLAPELNPDRAIFWQPPGYYVGMSFFVKIFGPGLETARGVSWAFMAASLCLLVLFLRRYPHGWMAILFLSLCWIDSPLTCIGNVVRMEGMLLFLACSGYLLCARNHWWKGLAVLSLSGLVHYNGVFFFCGAALAWLLQPSAWKRPAGSDIWAVAPVGILWLGYAAYVGFHWDWFIADMTVQFSRRTERGWLSLALAWPWLGYGLLYAGALCVAWARQRRWLLPATFGAASTALYVVQQEMWYVLFQFTGVILASWLAVVGIHAILQMVRVLPRWAPGVLNLFALPALLFHFYLQGIVEDPRGYPRDLAWGWGMRVADNVEYFTGSDLAIVSRKLRQALSGQENVWLAFDPPGDQMLYTGQLDENIHPFFPLFTEQRPDFVLVHRSKYIPDWIARYGNSIPDDAMLIHARDGNEQWRLFRVSPR